MMQGLRPCLNQFVECILSGEYYGIQQERNSLIVAFGGFWLVFLEDN